MDSAEPTSERNSKRSACLVLLLLQQVSIRTLAVSALISASAFAFVLACFACLACAALPAQLPQPGTVVLTWTVGDAAAPGACEAVGAGTFQVVLSDWEGHPAGQWSAACGQFATSVTGLAPDEYAGHAVLLDSAGNACTAPVDLADITVVGATTETFPVDFSVGTNN